MTDDTAQNPVSNRAQSLLAVDIGYNTTRTVLFDMVEGRYRFLAAGTAPTTANAPMFDASEGVRLALDQLHNVSGRAMLAQDEEILIPSTDDGAGADHLAVSLSAGEPLKMVVVGLLDKVSLASGLNLAKTIYADVVETLSLNDRRRAETQIDTILRLRPDVILIAGGTEKGASLSVLKQVSTLGMALYLLPESSRPDILYAGNSELQEQITAFMEPLAPLHIASNIRPSLSVEQLPPAQSALTNIFRQVQARKISGVAELDALSGGHLVPTSQALGRIVRFFSRIVPQPKRRGVLGIDIGGNSTTVAGAFNGDLRLRVFTRLGIGTGLKSLLEGGNMNNILRWLPLEVQPAYVLNYMQNKIVHPSTLPASREDMAIEQALSREVIQMAMREADKSFPRNANRLAQGMLPTFDPIVVSGSTIAKAPTAAQSMLMILDALQPVGIQQIILDKHNLTAALGAAMPINPTLVSQLLVDPIAFLNLGFVISPISQAKPDTPVLRVRVVYDTGRENVVEVNHGTIRRIPLPLGRRAKLFLDPLNRADVGAGPGKGIGNQRVVGGPFGIVIDARGRPLDLPASPKERRTAILRWLYTLEK